MTTPECSVIIPTRDCLEYLRYAVASVRLQENVDLEILVVDDGSSDGTWEWLSREAAQDPRVRLLKLYGHGPSGARNKALECARGQYVAFLDADDTWWPRKLSKQLSHHRSVPSVSFSFTDYLHVDPAGGVHGTCFDFWKPRFARNASFDFQILPEPEFAILGCNAVGTSTVIASRKALQDANGFANCKSAEDWDLWLRLARNSPVSFSRAVTASYMMRPGSETGNVSARLESLRKIVDSYALRRDATAVTAVRLARARIDIAEAEAARSQGRFASAAALHGRAFLARRDLRTLRAAAADLGRVMSPKNLKA